MPKLFYMREGLFLKVLQGVHLHAQSHYLRKEIIAFPWMISMTITSYLDDQSSHSHQTLTIDCIGEIQQ